MSAKALLSQAKEELRMAGIKLSHVTLFARHAMYSGDRQDVFELHAFYACDRRQEAFELHAFYLDENGHKTVFPIAHESAAEVIRLFRRYAIPAIERATKSLDSEAAKSPLEEAIAYFERKLKEKPADASTLVIGVDHAMEITAAAKAHLASQR